MILTLPWNTFAEEVRGRLWGARVYAVARTGGSLLTAADPTSDLVMRCQAPLPPAEAIAALEATGLLAAEGEWSFEAPATEVAPSVPESWVVAVAYRTAESKPGCWMDAFPSKPVPAQILQTLYDEFSQTGEMGDVSFEDFMRLAQPNVVMLSPDECRRYAAEKPA